MAKGGNWERGFVICGWSLLRDLIGVQHDFLEEDDGGVLFKVGQMCAFRRCIIILLFQKQILNLPFPNLKMYLFCGSQFD